MYMLTVSKHFDSAHKLENYEGKCSNLHGHRWVVEFAFKYETLNIINGIAEDFHTLSEIGNKLVDKLDHEYLNELFEFNPTAEQIAWYLYKEAYSLNPKINSVTVFETPKNKVTYYDESK